MRLAAGLRPGQLGSYSAPQDPLAVIRGQEGGEGRKRKERVRNREEKEGERRGGREGVEGMGGEKGGRVRLRYLSRGPKFLATPLHVERPGGTQATANKRH